MNSTASVTLSPLRPGREPLYGLSRPADVSTQQQTVIYPSAEHLATIRPQVAYEEGETDLPPTAEPLLFGRYRREGELGRGGMGVVWRAFDEVLGIPVALKLVPEEVARSPHELEGLRKEVLRGIALTHPGIVRVYSFERDAVHAAIVMEFVDGHSLADLQYRQPDSCFEPETLRPWLEQLCAVLDYAHGEARIAHRDLKPRNIMITREGRLKVADFGIASSLSEHTCAVSVRNDSAGTPPYMSPQQAMGERPSITDDIYSLGATLYDLLTGRPPFYRGNIIAQVLHDVPDSVAERREELGVHGRVPVSPGWERAIAACLSKNPAERPPSGAALLDLLENPSRALVPYGELAAIPVESLRLQVPEHEQMPPAALQTIDVQPIDEPPLVARPVPRPRSSRVVQPENTFFAFCRELQEEIVSWTGRLFKLALVAAVFFGVYHLAQRFAFGPPPEPAIIMHNGRPATIRVNANTNRVEVGYLPPGVEVFQGPPPPGYAPVRIGR